MWGIKLNKGSCPEANQGGAAGSFCVGFRFNSVELSNKSEGYKDLLLNYTVTNCLQ